MGYSVALMADSTSRWAEDVYKRQAQGRTAAAGIGVVAKKPDQNGKAITMAVLVETYACLLYTSRSVVSIASGVLVKSRTV